MSRILSLALALVGASVFPTGASAQTRVLDDGAFRLVIDGREVGRETFAIRQSGTGNSAVVLAQGRVTLDRRQLESELELSGALRPAAYQVELEGAEDRRITGQIAGGRFSAKILSPGGEMMREYLTSDGAILVDDGVAHHYYFIARAFQDGHRTVPLIVPQQNRQVSATIRGAGGESVEVGGSSVQAQHLVVQPAGGDVRHVWVDDQARVLRVEIPARDYTAIRTDLPG
ncbi:MAG: hypothetical protein ACRELV_15530 [Longimicrobiales bacterium]